MDSRDLKRLSSKAKEQSTHLESAFHQLAQDVAVRQKVNDASVNEIKEQLETINKVTQENSEAFKRYDKITETNARDIETLKDQISILKNCIVDLQKRNQFLEDLNASLINQLKKLVEGLSTSAIQEQNVMKGVIGEILSRVCNKTECTKVKRVTTQNEQTEKRNRKSNVESIPKSGTSKKYSVESNREKDSEKITNGMIHEDTTDKPSNAKNCDAKSDVVSAGETTLPNKSEVTDEFHALEVELEGEKDTEENWKEAENILREILNKEDLETMNGIDDKLKNGDEIVTYEEILKNLQDDVALNSVTELENTLKDDLVMCNEKPVVDDDKKCGDDFYDGKQLTENISKEITNEVLPEEKNRKISDSKIEENSKIIQPNYSEKCAEASSSNKLNEKKKKKQRKRKKSDTKSDKSSKSVSTEMESNEKEEEKVTSFPNSNSLEEKDSKKRIQRASECRGDEAINSNTEHKVVKCAKEFTEKNSSGTTSKKHIVETEEKENKLSNKNDLLKSIDITDEKKDESDPTVNEEPNKNDDTKLNTKTKVDINKVGSGEIKRDKSVGNNDPILEEISKAPKLQNGSCDQTKNNSESLVFSEARTLSPTAKEFEPMREYGKAKLHIKTEIEKKNPSSSSCPKLFDVGMADKLGAQEKEGPETDQNGVCVQCGSKATQRCANCRQVFYCKRECQKENWKAGHKNKCKPFKIEKNFTLGRYLVATRDFKAGDVIFKEEPLVIGPKQITEPICLGCYKRVDGSYRCRKCTWPLCGPACEKSLDHQPECVVGKEMGSPVDIQDFSEANHFYEVVTTLRCLALKKKSPKKYSQLLNLESHFADRQGTEVYNTNQKRVVNMLRNYFMIVDFPPDEVDASEGSIHQMTGIIDVNSVDIPLKESEIVGIYPTYSMLEHSCTPNIKYKINRSKQITVKAAVNIRQGEHLSTIYTHMLWGSAARREHLMSTRYFMCTCRRCADPTELGTNFSALRCKNCPTGFLMSSTPLDESAIWVCPSCNVTVPPEEVKETILQLGEEVEKALANPNVKTIESLIERASSTIVHPNHFHLFAAKHSLLQMLGRDSAGLDGELMKKKEKLCQEFLKTCTALDPGMSKLASYAGVALYEYHLAVLARARHGPTEEQVDKEALKKDLDTAKALLQQCIKVLQDESNDKAETQLRAIAQENLIELNQWAAPLFE